MKISVITVCFNEEKNIASTIRSVLRQDTADYEYIICDGLSTDKTVEIAGTFKSAFEQKGIEYKINSSKDGGIYFGMNNGIDMATGDYVIFMNAGDCFHGKSAISTIIKELEKETELPDVVYGDAVYVDRGYYEIRKAKELSAMCEGMPFFHQSVFVTTNLIKREKFDTSFRICADFDMMSKFYRQGKKFKHIETKVSDFYAGGISSTQMLKSARESFIVRERYGFDYDKKAIEKQMRKSEFLAKVKYNLPAFLWKLWCVNKKHRSPESELGNI